MASVSQLGYVGIGTGDEKAWHELATNILGMQVIRGDDRSTSYLRMDECHHRLELRSNGSDDLEFVGWEVPDPATLQRVAQQLEDGGVKVTPGTRDDADDRRVVDLFTCVDPSGIPTEVFCGRPVNQQPSPDRPRAGRDSRLRLGVHPERHRVNSATPRSARRGSGSRNCWTELKRPTPAAA